MELTIHEITHETLYTDIGNCSPLFHNVQQLID
jgi:hypothetical protein